MPPYAAQESHQDALVLRDDLSHEDPFMDISLGPKPLEVDHKNHASLEDDASATPSATESESADSQDSSSSFLERLMDWNPCAGTAGGSTDDSFSLPNPSSAIFKTRVCSECGGKCTKLKGYNKEIVENTVVDEETGEESIVKTKIYFHKWCAKVNDYRKDHKKDYDAVMCNLLDHFRAIELEAQMKLEAELKLAQEMEEEKVRREEESAAKDAEASQLEVSKSKTFLKRVKKSGKRVKKTFSMGSCMGKTSAASVAAVDGSACGREEI